MNDSCKLTVSLMTWCAVLGGMTEWCLNGRPSLAWLFMNGGLVAASIIEAMRHRKARTALAKKENELAVLCGHGRKKWESCHSCAGEFAAEETGMTYYLVGEKRIHSIVIGESTLIRRKEVLGGFQWSYLYCTGDGEWQKVQAPTPANLKKRLFWGRWMDHDMTALAPVVEVITEKEALRLIEAADVSYVSKN